MNEAHHSEVEKVLLYISEARERAERARLALVKSGAEAHLIAALQETEDHLRQEHRRLLQQTFYAVPGSTPLPARVPGDSARTSQSAKSGVEQIVSS
jgi:hypothetical protein